MGRATQKRSVVQMSAAGSRRGIDWVIGEEPLEIQLGGEPYAITMRTPGDDFELVHGFLFAEGIIARPDQVRRLSYRGGVAADGTRSYNVIDATLAAGVAPPTRTRNVYTSSSCGVCGTSSIESVERLSAFDPSLDEARVSVGDLLGLADQSRANQRLFDKTGGVHASALFSVAHETPRLVCLREDVGRHNAVDKLVGRALQRGELPLAQTVLQLSGRVSFELVQKAHLAGIPIVSAVGAPSALALDLAERAGITVAGFARGGRVNVYTHPGRIH